MLKPWTHEKRDWKLLENWKNVSIFNMVDSDIEGKQCINYLVIISWVCASYDGWMMCELSLSKPLKTVKSHHNCKCVALLYLLKFLVHLGLFSPPIQPGNPDTRDYLGICQWSSYPNPPYPVNPRSGGVLWCPAIRHACLGAISLRSSLSSSGNAEYLLCILATRSAASPQTPCKNMVGIF